MKETRHIVRDMVAAALEGSEHNWITLYGKVLSHLVVRHADLYDLPAGRVRLLALEELERHI